MVEPQHNVRIDPPGVIVDLIADGRAYEFKRGIRERSRLRGVLMDLAQIVASSPLARGNLVLIEPEMSSETIAEVWSGAEQIFRPEVIGRLAMIEARFEGGHELQLRWHPADLPDGESGRIEEAVRKHRKRLGNSAKSTPGHSGHEVLRVLLTRWMNVANPTVTLAQLGEETGYTYKTVRQALDKLSKHLVRFGHRGVELQSFPRDAWARLLLESDSVRETIRFSTKGEMTRTPAAMLKRFYAIPKNETNHVGIGGIEGARFYDPELDLAGQPRLDFTVHCPEGDPDLNFIRQLDPSLSPVETRDGASSLVVHLLRRPRNYFDNGFADPVECLLDLQEMRLDGQARQFLRSFPAVKGDDF